MSLECALKGDSFRSRPSKAPASSAFVEYRHLLLAYPKTKNPPDQSIETNHGRSVDECPLLCGLQGLSLRIDEIPYRVRLVLTPLSPYLYPTLILPPTIDFN
jgi:hypothetical protein